jgi:Uma2 family endonuclease
MHMATTKLMTVEVLLEREDFERYELCRGEPVFMPGTFFDHGTIGSAILIRLGIHVLQHGLGRVTGPDTGFRLRDDPAVLLYPDVAFVAAERLPPADQWRQFLPPAPNLVVEVLLDSNRPGYVAAKIGEYMAAGTKLIWIVDPRWKTVTVHRPDGTQAVLSEDGVLDGADVVPAFRLPVADVFS